jgi:hypothetical protein
MLRKGVCEGQVLFFRLEKLYKYVFPGMPEFWCLSGSQGKAEVPLTLSLSPQPRQAALAGRKLG